MCSALPAWTLNVHLYNCSFIRVYFITLTDAEVSNVCIECSVVTGSCFVDAMAYTTAGCKVGHVRLNGEVVWQGWWNACGVTFFNPRGVTILLIDPFRCSVHDIRPFDTHISSYAATQLSDSLLAFNQSSVIVGVSADEPTRRLSNALSTLRQFGVEVADVEFRGTFAFIVQKGYPSKTVLSKVLTASESNIAPGRVTAVITGKSRFTQDPCENAVNRNVS